MSDEVYFWIVVFCWSVLSLASMLLWDKFIHPIYPKSIAKMQSNTTINKEENK